MAVNARWDIPALKDGGFVTLTFAAPVLVIARLVHDSNSRSPYLVPLVLLAITGFVLGAGVAAWRQRSQTPLSHGIVTAVGTFTAVQTVLVIINLIRGSDIAWFSIFFNLTTTLGAGCLGGLLGMVLHRSGLESRR